MTKEQQNQIIKDKWVEHLQTVTSIPENIEEVYRTWVVNKIAEANQQLLQQQQAPVEEQQGA